MSYHHHELSANTSNQPNIACGEQHYNCNVWYTFSHTGPWAAPDTAAMGLHHSGCQESYLIGADFLREHHLLVDVRGNRFTDAETHLSVQGIVSPTSSLSLALQNPGTHSGFGMFLAEFPEVWKPSSGEQPVKHGVTHHITTTVRPVHARTHTLAPERLQIAR